MFISLFDLFKIGIGPSSSHTVGPMRAVGAFLADMDKAGELPRVGHITVEVYGSLALTGMGHGTDKAILLGLSGQEPASVDPDAAEKMVESIHSGKSLSLLGRIPVAFDTKQDLIFNRRSRLPFHSNGMKFISFDGDGNPIREGVYYSIGGGFIVDEEQARQLKENGNDAPDTHPYPFESARQLLAIGREQDLHIADIVRANEQAVREPEAIETGIEEIWSTMENCIDRGCEAGGILPGRLKLQRRAGRLYRQLSDPAREALNDSMTGMDWVNLWAIAVNEENAAGGRVVTAPTNGAAGIIPAVLRYYHRLCRNANDKGIHDFFLTATAIGALYKQNASLSGAEVGCQGEVGVACSMAAAGLTAALGGSNEQIENAAEIGMEHNLGLTCDPIGGLVQIPCIERNAMGAVKAIDASRMAMLGDGTHRVSLDRVIDTMRRTGADMKTKYKETSRGGLAVNVTEC